MKGKLLDQTFAQACVFYSLNSLVNGVASNEDRAVQSLKAIGHGVSVRNKITRIQLSCSQAS